MGKQLKSRKWANRQIEGAYASWCRRAHALEGCLSCVPSPHDVPTSVCVGAQAVQMVSDAQALQPVVQLLQVVPFFQLPAGQLHSASVGPVQWPVRQLQWQFSHMPEAGLP